MISNDRKPRPDVAAIICLSLTAFFYRGWFIPGTAPSPDGLGLDNMAHYAILARHGRHIMEGFGLIWDAIPMAGKPALGDMQRAVFYPPQWLFAILPTLTTMKLIGIIHVFWAGWGGCLAARHFVRSRSAAILAGLFFCWAGWFPVRLFVGHFDILRSTAWIPWVLHFALCLSEGRRRAFVPLAICAAMLVAAGQPQAPIFVLALYFPAILLARRKIAWREAIVRPLAPAVLAAALVAPFIVAFAWIVPDHPRMTWSIEQLMRGSLHTANLPTLFFPLWYGHWTASYWGWDSPGEIGPALGGAGLAVLLAGRAWRDRRARGWLIVAAGAVLLALGDTTPLGPAMAQIPPFSLLRAPARWLVVALFAVAMAVGICWERLGAARAKRAVIPAAACGVIGLLLIPYWRLALPTVVTVLQSLPGDAASEWARAIFAGNSTIPLSIAVASVAAALFFATFLVPIRFRRVARILRAIILIAEIWAFLQTMPETVAHERYTSPSLLEELRPLDPRYLREPYWRGHLFMGDFESLSLIAGIPSINGYGEVMHREHRRQVTRVIMGDSRSVELLGIDWIAPARATPPGFHRVADEPVVIASRDAWGSRFRFLAGRRKPPTEQDVIDSAVRAWPEMIESARRIDNGTRIVIEADTAGWLIIGDAPWRGFTVSINDRPGRIEAVAGQALLGVEIEPGRHIIEVLYEPFGVKAASYLSVIVGFLLFGIHMAIRRRERNSNDWRGGNRQEPSISVSTPPRRPA